jgi:hypothetical protein
MTAGSRKRYSTKSCVAFDSSVNGLVELKRAREAISELFELDRSFDWPFRLDRNAAGGWVRSALEVYSSRYRDSLHRKIIARLQSALRAPEISDHDCASLDGYIAGALDRGVSRCGFRVQRKDGRYVAISMNRNERIPHYTTDPRILAKLLQPDTIAGVSIPVGATRRQTVAYCIQLLSRLWDIAARRAAIQTLSAVRRKTDTPKGMAPTQGASAQSRCPWCILRKSHR